MSFQPSIRSAYTRSVIVTCAFAGSVAAKSPVQYSVGRPPAPGRVVAEASRDVSVSGLPLAAIERPWITRAVSSPIHARLPFADHFAPAFMI